MVVKVDLLTINALRRPRKSDKMEPRRHPATLADAHRDAGGESDEGDVGDFGGVDGDVVGENNDDADNGNHIHDPKSKLKTKLSNHTDKDVIVNTYFEDEDKHIQEASSKVNTRSGFFSLCS